MIGDLERYPRRVSYNGGLDKFDCRSDFRRFSVLGRQKAQDVPLRPTVDPQAISRCRERKRTTTSSSAASGCRLRSRESPGA